MCRIAVVPLTLTMLFAWGCANEANERGAPVTMGQRPIGQAREQSAEAAKRPPAPLFKDLGDHHYPLSETSRSPMARRYFDQGMTLLYAFNHAEAARSFEAAAKHDPDWPMAWWGYALVLGPNINAPMADENVPKAYEAAQKAVELARQASEKERAYVMAVAKRYAAEPVKDRSALDRAYADAMEQVSRRYPDDLDAATLYAEAIMDTTPWDYWTKQGRPKPEMAKAIEAMESVLERKPNHAGAIHYYIHAVEAGPEPEVALAAADRLKDLVPGAGHLVHMPSHIYAQLGLWHDASLANERATKADQSYIGQCNAQGFYPAMYYPHNIHFLWYTSGMEGRSRTSIDSARQVAEVVKQGHCCAPEGVRLRFLPLFAMARFGQWDGVLAVERPADLEPYEQAMWHYARGIAYSATGQLDQARQELSQLERIAGSDAARAADSPILPGGKLIEIARHELAGDVAFRGGNADRGIAELRKAVELEDSLPYMEPPYWYYPARHALGSALLRAARAPEAEVVFREDLQVYPNNGWALYGLEKSLRAQGKNELADEVKRRYEVAWIRADVEKPVLRFEAANQQ